jgi:hypothetical protein
MPQRISSLHDATTSKAKIFHNLEGSPCPKGYLPCMMRQLQKLRCRTRFHQLNFEGSPCPKGYLPCMMRQLQKLRCRTTFHQLNFEGSPCPKGYLPCMMRQLQKLRCRTRFHQLNLHPTVFWISSILFSALVTVTVSCRVHRCILQLL